MQELKTIQNLIQALRKLPGVGTKSAERMAYQMLEMRKESLIEMRNAIDQTLSSITFCPVCGAYKEGAQCSLCEDVSRDETTLVVVANFKDALAFERLNTYHGQYHILRGTLSPTRGIGIHDLLIDSLCKRLDKGNIKEVILATDATIDGETTALYIAKRMEAYPSIALTRLAYGLPMGGHLDYADELTLRKSFEGRKSLK